MLHFACSECGKQLQAQDTAAGKKVKCPGCGKLSAVPVPLKEAVGGQPKPATVAGRPSREPVAEQPTVPPNPTQSSGVSQEPVAPATPKETYDFLAPALAPDELGR